MASSTEDGNHTITNQEYYCNLSLVGTPKITVLILALPLFISAVLGNVLIIVGLRKVSSPHPPSKLLLNCLACTDLATSLISYPLYGALSFSPEQSIVCYTLWILLTISALVFRGVSLTTTTAVSVDRLLALLLGLRYRQVVTVWRVKGLIAFLWLLSISVTMVAIHSVILALRMAFASLFSCIVISSFCYIKIYYTLRLSQAQVQVQNQSHPEQQNGEGIQLNEARYRKTVTTAVWVQVLFLTCYLPFGLLFGFTIIPGLNTPLYQFPFALTAALMHFYSTLNPLLYCWRMRELRQAVKDTIKKFCC